MLTRRPSRCPGAGSTMGRACLSEDEPGRDRTCNPRLPHGARAELVERRLAPPDPRSSANDRGEQSALARAGGRTWGSVKVTHCDGVEDRRKLSANRPEEFSAGFGASHGRISNDTGVA